MKENEIVQINRQPGIILRSSEGIHTVVMLHVEGNLIRNLYVVRNPDKLKHVGKGSCSAGEVNPNAESDDLTLS